MSLHTKLLNLKRLKAKVEFLLTKRHSAQKLSDELDQELGNFVSKNFSLITDNFDCLFDKFAFVISYTIDKHAPMDYKRNSNFHLKKELNDSNSLQ